MFTTLFLFLLSLVSITAAQQVEYSSPEEFYGYMPACTLVEVEQNTLHTLGDLNYVLVWPYQSGAFVPTTSTCRYGKMNIVRLERLPNGMYAPFPIDIPDGARRVRAIVGEKGAYQKYFLGRFNGETMVRPTGKKFLSDGAPLESSGLRGASGQVIATLTQVNVVPSNATCTSDPIYPGASLGNRTSTIKCN